MGSVFDLRKPCSCGSTGGRSVERNGQDVVYCVLCDAYQYCRPKHESGRAPRTVSGTHDGIRPKLRARILERATGRCELCGGGPPSVINVGHLLSVKDGHAAGMPDEEINDPENLAALCEECNLGLGEESVSLRLALRIAMLRAGIARRKAVGA